MKNNALAAVLVVALFALGLCACLQSMRYFFTLRQMGVMQNQVNQVNFRLSLAQALVNESVEYSKRNPAIDPILQQFHFKAPPAANPTASTLKPAAK